MLIGGWPGAGGNGDHDRFLMSCAVTLATACAKYGKRRLHDGSAELVMSIWPIA
jgi:hypothetical protein